MILRTAYIRFYRAFNFDYLRKHHPGAKQDPWDHIGENFYPYVKLDIDSELTCVVGANESGKSQILQAVECAVGKTVPLPKDFCRHSTHFTVAETMKLPHFGLHFTEVRDEESAELAKVIQPAITESIESFRVFRTGPVEATIYLEGGSEHQVSDLDALKKILPNVFRVESERAIPNSVPISFLARGGSKGGVAPGLTRPDRLALTDPIADSTLDLRSLLSSPEKLAEIIQQHLQEASFSSGLSERERQGQQDQMDLAYDLLVTVGGIHPSAFEQLRTALRDDDEGMANGIVALMNDKLEESLNLAKWWSQDRQFRLAIAARDSDVVFTIRDRTGSEYSFAERSGGLKYFLSYLVQILTHIGNRSGHEILLMDEPDAYLSNQGQQDLLRVLHEFASPLDNVHRGQVVFVTHSPFLIDKNHAHRIRVLDKGSGDEGARVVRDVGRNHFEPVRSALGGFVGETAFIGNCNLMVEGIADQIYLAGMSTLLRNEGGAAAELLDLNRITLVPAGSASHVPDKVFLARGRDADKPAVIVLLDGDKAGREAAAILRRGGPRGKRMIREEYVLQIGRDKIPGVESDISSGPVEIEDLIPIEIGLVAAERYMRDMEVEAPGGFPNLQETDGLLAEANGVFEAVQNALDQANIDLQLAKISFARHAVAVCMEREPKEGAGQVMRSRFAALFSCLADLQRKAERDRDRESITRRVDREKARFKRDMRTPNKADLKVLLDRIEASVDSAVEGDVLLMGIRRMRQEYDLDRNLNEQIDNIDALFAKLDTLQYAEIQASQPEDP